MLPAIRSPHSFCLTANEKDFSLSLEMTMRKNGILPPSPAKGRPEGDVRGMAALFLRHSPSFLWKEAVRRGGGWLTVE